ncbi:hypothetical protein GCM10020000_48900 [Streptomyces olivoverticillatus]
MDSAAHRRDAAVRAAVTQGVVGPGRPIAGLLDVRGMREAARALKAAFGGPAPALHAFAVKAAPLVPVLRLLAEEGLGCEVASPGELALARAAGVAPGDTVLDSPAKTTAELREALALGVAVNADSREELARLDALVRSAPTASPLGLRVNPQVGGGTIDALSTATATSKFGVALLDEGARDWLVRAYAERPWLTRLHAHTGSQGCPPELLAAGVRATYELAEEINEAVGGRQVRAIDIGGGLPVNFASDEVTPTYREYADLLAATAPGLFDGRYGLVTEFGRSLLAKSGMVLARVEYAKTAGGPPHRGHARGRPGGRTDRVRARGLAAAGRGLRRAGLAEDGRPPPAGRRRAVLLRRRPGRDRPHPAPAGGGRPRRAAGHRRVLLLQPLRVQLAAPPRGVRLRRGPAGRAFRARPRPADARRARRRERRRARGGPQRAALTAARPPARPGLRLAPPGAASPAARPVVR